MNNSKELVIIACQPDDLYFSWQLEVQIANFRKYGLSDKLRYLMFLPHDRLEGGWNKATRELPIKYPEVNFYWYEDTANILENYVQPYQYIPLLRPYVLGKHFKEFPELTEKAVLYIDSDVIWTKNPDFLDKYKDDEVCYLSDTKSYLGIDYWDSKVNDVKPEMVEAYKSFDSLELVANRVGISREIIKENDGGTGGAQYLLKGIDSKFWNDVFSACVIIRASLSSHMPGSINSKYFESENKGFQSWTADMWAVLWNLWKRGMKTVTPPEMDFAWATSSIELYDKVYIYHNAGATGQPFIVDGIPHLLFYKASTQYVNNVTTPFDDDGHVLTSPFFCSCKYAEAIEDAKKNREFSIIINN